MKQSVMKRFLSLILIVSFLVAASVQPANAFSFQDTKGHWAQPSITAVAERGLMIGVSDTSFAPNAYLTMAELYMILYRLAGKPQASAQDYLIIGLDNKNAWYYESAFWVCNALDEKLRPYFSDDIPRGVPLDPAVEADIVGVEFRPNFVEYRGWVMRCFYNMARLKSLDTSYDPSVLLGFDDVSERVERLDYVAWCVTQGIVKGYDDNTLRFLGPVTRAEMAEMLNRFIQRYHIEDIH